MSFAAKKNDPRLRPLELATLLHVQLQIAMRERDEEGNSLLKIMRFSYNRKKT
jgi:hypothetical protein